MARGHLIAFEGLDQSGKQTQAERLLAAFRAAGHVAEFLTFPAYDTAIGEEIDRALHGQRDYHPDTLQLLYIANRFEFKPKIETWLTAGTMVVCDRYLASSIAYGEAQGVDAAWLADTQTALPQPSLTILLDMSPTVSLTRKKVDRDKFERDIPLLGRVRDSYLRQAHQSSTGIRISAERDTNQVGDEVISAVRARLGLLYAPALPSRRFAARPGRNSRALLRLLRHRRSGRSRREPGAGNREPSLRTHPSHSRAVALAAGRFATSCGGRV